MYDLEFTNTGIIAPSSADIKISIQELFVEAFGSSLNLDDATPQGQLITSLTEIIVQKNADMLFVINQFNPNNASGIWQDALAQLYFLDRKQATPTTVNCVCNGLAGTVLPGIDTSLEPAQAISLNGDIFNNVNTATIPDSGTITLQFQSAELGAIPAAANSINAIYKQIIGWDSVNNPQSGVTGTDQESRLDFEQRRKNSLALNATGSLEAVYARVYNVTNVTDLVVVENDTSEPTIIQGVSLVRNSIYVCVNGGTDNDIAEAIHQSKSGGCATNGAVSVLLPNLQIPIKFDRPTNTDIYLQVTINRSSDATGNIEEIIKEAIINNFLGLDGSDKITMGETIYASRFYCAINSLGLKVISIKISTDGTNFNDYVEFNLNQLPVISEDNITVVING